MDAKALAAWLALTLTAAGMGGSAIWTVGQMQATGQQLNSAIVELSADVKSLSTEMGGLSVVVGGLKDGHQDHEERLRRIEQTQ